jgi:pyrroloquinoline quinone biosynthesis protein D
MTLPPSFVPRLARRARLRFDRHEGRHMIVYPERGLVLNETGAAIAAKCDGSRTLEAIAAELAAAHGAPLAEVERDVVAFVLDLRRRRLLDDTGEAP